MTNILIIDDEIEICKQVSIILSKNSYNCDYVTSYQELVNYLSNNKHIDVALVDLWIKNSSKQGLDIINELNQNFKNLVIISISGHANIDNAIESVKAGANDFIEKPFETKKLLHIIQKNILDLQNRLTLENYRNKISFHSKINNIGNSEEIRKIFKICNKIILNDTILLSGASGTGKNYLANYIHMSLSNNNPDTFINLSEIIMNESDLLKINSLHNYFTIYVNDYESYNQIELIKFINLVKSKKINAVMILDTKKYDKNNPIVDRLKIFIHLKSLIERKDEIFILFKHYVNEFSIKKFSNTVIYSPDIEETLINYSWPGNIFEIMNLSENIVNLLSNSNLIVTSQMLKNFLSSSLQDENIFHLNYKEAKDKFEKDYLIKKLQLNNWNMTNTAKMLKLDRVSLYRKIKSLDIKID